MNILRITLYVVLAICSIFLMMLILMHKGRGGGLSDMFGGGIASGAGSSGVAERNLNRITIGFASVWAAVCIALVVVERFDPTIAGVE